MKCTTCQDTGTTRHEGGSATLCPDCRPISLAERRNKPRSYLKCIRLPLKHLTNYSWCGRDLGGEPAFRDADHALENALNRTGLSTCPSCTHAIKAAFRLRA